MAYFEQMTYENILNSMMAKIPSDIDTREGSVIYNALAPCALEIEEIYLNLNAIMENMTLETATLASLELLGEMVGITPNSGKNAVLLAKVTPTTMEIDGSVFSYKDNLYTAYKDGLVNRPEGEWLLECTEPGASGNIPVGSSLIPVEDIPDLESIIVEEIIDYGTEDETADEFRERYKAHITQKPFAGNQAYYREVVGALDGVGALKIFPLRNGPGTVAIICLNENLEPMSSDEVLRIQKIVCPEWNETYDGSYSEEWATGSGLAPIDHCVTIETVLGYDPINIAVNITTKDGYSTEGLKTQITEAAGEYIKEVIGNWGYEGNKRSVISHTKLLSKIIGIEGVDDITSLTINGKSESYQVAIYNLPKLGTVTVG